MQIRRQPSQLSHIELAIADTLMKLMSFRGVSAQAATAATGNQRQALWAHENGRAVPKMETIVKYCDCYGFNLKDFFHAVDLNAYPAKYEGEGYGRSSLQLEQYLVWIEKNRGVI